MQEILDALNTARQPKRPEGQGWFTLAEIAKKRGVQVETARDQINRLVERGIMEKSERCGMLKYYRMKKHEN